MENNNQFTLIKGTFEAQEAEYLLNALINYKINFHSNEDFSNHIRFNKDIKKSKKRIQELIQMKESIQKLTSEAKSQHLNLVINSTITLDFEK